MKLKEKVDIGGPKVINRSFVKDPSEKLALQRLRILELSRQLGNIAEACRRGGMGRTSFYEWKRRYQTHGLDGLRDLPPVHKTHPFTTPAHVRDAVFALSLEHPSWGCKHLASELLQQGLKVSDFTIQGMLSKAGLGTRFDRFLRMEEELLKGVELPVEQLRQLGKLNPCLKERHVKA